MLSEIGRAIRRLLAHRLGQRQALEQAFHKFFGGHQVVFKAAREMLEAEISVLKETDDAL